VSVFSIWVICLDNLSLIFIIRDISLLFFLDNDFIFINAHLVGLITIDLVKLGLFIRSKKSKMVLDSHVVNSIELSYSGVCTNQLGVSQESPDLSQSHGEGLFTLVSFDLSGVGLVPSL
jgi:hypothetical protein